MRRGTAHVKGNSWQLLSSFKSVSSCEKPGVQILIKPLGGRRYISSTLEAVARGLASKMGVGRAQRTSIKALGTSKRALGRLGKG